MAGSRKNVKTGKKWTAVQDGGVGRCTLSACTIKRTTNLKIKGNQNCQKIKLYGSPTTKELKKKHSFRLVGGVEMGSQGGKEAQQGRDWQGSETDHSTQGSSVGKESLKISGYKNLWGLQWREKLPASQESLLERPTGS